MITIVIIGVLAIVVGLAGFMLYDSKKDVNEKAISLATIGNFIDARALVRSHLESNPEDGKSLFTMSRIYSMEGDFLSEASYLEKIKKTEKYSDDFPENWIHSRIADIYYQLDMFEESFFHYLDCIQSDPKNIEALLRLGFMALGQREFILADLFLKRIPEDKINLSSYFIARGVISAHLHRTDESVFLEKAYSLDKNSMVAGFLYALSLGKLTKFEKAIAIANEVEANVEEEYVRFTVFQLIMSLYMGMKDSDNSAKHARLCLELARLNNWVQEYLDSAYFFALCSVARNNLNEAEETLREVEYERPDDEDVINIGNYRYKVETGVLKIGEEDEHGYSPLKCMEEQFDKIFPNERYYEFSGMKSQESFNIRGIVSEDGKKISEGLDQIGVDTITRFASLKGNAFKNTCTRMIMSLNYRVAREIPYNESDGSNFIGLSNADRSSKALFRIRKWKNVKVSDVFLRDLINAAMDLNATRGFLLGAAELTAGARKVLNSNQDKLTVINGKEFEDLLEKCLK